MNDSSARQSGAYGHFDSVVGEWQGQLPDIDWEPVAIIGRAYYFGRQIEGFYTDNVAPFGLTPADFFVLCELRRAGPPYQLTPSRLGKALIRSSGGMTKQLDRVESAGLLERSHDPNDRRAVLVSLTDKGLALTNDVLKEHMRREADLVSCLTQTERQQLTKLLDILMHAIDSRDNGDDIDGQHDATQARDHA